MLEHDVLPPRRAVVLDRQFAVGSHVGVDLVEQSRPQRPELLPRGRLRDDGGRARGDPRERYGHVCHGREIYALQGDSQTSLVPFLQQPTRLTALPKIHPKESTWEVFDPSW